MGLVDYGSSDEETDNETEVEEKKEEPRVAKSISQPEVVNTKIEESSNNDNDKELFSNLPKPKKTFSFLGDDNKLSKLLLNKSNLPLGKKESVKIAIPSVSEYEEDSEQPLPKKLKPSLKGAGLFSVLPPPKNAVKTTDKAFVPHVLTKNQVNKSVSKVDKVKNVTKTTLNNKVCVDEEDDDTLVGGSFFGSGLTETSSILEEDNESKLLDNSQGIVTPSIPQNTPPPVQTPSAEHYVSETYNQQPNANVTQDVHMSVAEVSREGESSSTENPFDLDETALQILCGNKKKRDQMPMNIIDLSSEEVLPDSKEWLLKQFTEEKRGRSHGSKKGHGFSSQSRRKHQITYLAYQAKEQELELQNQWANNRMSRRQTQSKYGF